MIVKQRAEPEGGVLYVVGTPIGNLGDLSERVKKVLKKVSFIACEDTRHSANLLNNLGSKAQRISFHQHNIQKRLPKLLGLLKGGESLAIISDAGLPGISDPGEELISEARKLGHRVICIPGPCAAITALVSSGLPCKRFCFEGFLPTKKKERKEKLKVISDEERTTVLFESPHKLLQLLEELAGFCGENRPLQVARELTKYHEEYIGSTIDEAIKHFRCHKPLGEFTLILGGADKQKTLQKTDQEWINQLNELIMKGESASEAVRHLAQSTGHSKRYLYELLHKELRKDHS